MDDPNLVATFHWFRQDSGMDAEPRLWTLARKLQATAQTGLEFNTNEYDRERYELISKIAAELMAAQCDTPIETFQKMFDEQDGCATPKVEIEQTLNANKDK